MKKLIVGLLAAFMMTMGFVAFTGSPASARPADCPYSGCIATDTSSTATADRNGAKIRVTVDAVGSNLTPKGRITLTVSKIKKNGNLKQVQTVFSDLRRGTTSFNINGLPRGRYAYSAEYENNEKFGFSYSSDNGRFRVR